MSPELGSGERSSRDRPAARPGTDPDIAMIDISKETVETVACALPPACGARPSLREATEREP